MQFGDADADADGVAAPATTALAALGSGDNDGDDDASLAAAARAAAAAAAAGDDVAAAAAAHLALARAGLGARLWRALAPSLASLPAAALSAARRVPVFVLHACLVGVEGGCGHSEWRGCQRMPRLHPRHALM